MTTWAVQSRLDRQLAHLRETSGYRIYRSPGGWSAYKPGRPGEIQAETLDDLAGQLAGTPAARHSSPPFTAGRNGGRG
jgi:hypothetical protein